MTHDDGCCLVSARATDAGNRGGVDGRQRALLDLACDLRQCADDLCANRFGTIASRRTADALDAQGGRALLRLRVAALDGELASALEPRHWRQPKPARQVTPFLGELELVGGPDVVALPSKPAAFAPARPSPAAAPPYCRVSSSCLTSNRYSPPA
jgi:hypothetical protein